MFRGLIVTHPEDATIECIVQGQIKWFDPVRGFGFLADASGGSDVLLHANVLRSFGQSSVADGAMVEVRAIATPRGRQAVEVVMIQPPPSAGQAPIADLAALDSADLDALPLLPARIKWFDKAKGFGFANLFGRRGDVFLHVEVLRHCGFADLLPGEAVSLRVIDGPRGLMAAQVVAWDRAATEAAGGAPDAAPDPDTEMAPRCAHGAIHPAVELSTLLERMRNAAPRAEVVKLEPTAKVAR